MSENIPSLIPRAELIKMVGTDSILIYDIETATKGKKPNSEVDEFRILGAYSYKQDTYIDTPDLQVCQELINDHDIVVGHNSSAHEAYGSAYDQPILEREGVSFADTLPLDTLEISKKRLQVMLYIKVESYKLGALAKQFEFPVMKGELDFSILQRTYDQWTPEERKQVRDYLHDDVIVTKLLFEKLIEYFIVFRQFVSEEEKQRWGWLTRSSASLAYHITCKTIGLREEYSDKGGGGDVGGYVRLPKGMEYENVWYMDVASLYPHIMMMFNIFGNPVIEKQMKEYHDILNRGETVKYEWFTGNDVFKINGKYRSDKQNVMSEEFQVMYKQRKPLKKSNPALATAYKILLNSTFGYLYSPTFKSTYYPHSGEDICSLGQQINHYMEEYFDRYDFETIYGDTDSVLIVDTKQRPKEDQKELVGRAVKEFREFVADNVPFPSPTFDVDIEYDDPLEYVRFSQTDGVYNKKRYWYTYFKKDEDGNMHRRVHVTGFDIIKRNATPLSYHIFKKYIEPKIVDGERGVSKSFLKEKIREEIDRDIGLLAIKKRCKPSRTYKNHNQLEAQISREYLDGDAGKVGVIKNRRVGRVGSGDKYCTVEEAKEANLQFYDLILDKVWNELDPFIKPEQQRDYFSDDSGGDLFDC